MIRNVKRLSSSLPKPNISTLFFNSLKASRILGFSSSLPLLIFFTLVIFTSSCIYTQGMPVLPSANMMTGIVITTITKMFILFFILIAELLIAFTATFILLLEKTPPDSRSAADFTLFISPIFLAVLMPLLLGNILLAAPSLTLLSLCLLPLLCLTSSQSESLLKLMLMFITAKVNSRGRTRTMLNAIMGNIRPSKLLIPFLDQILQIGLLNNLAKQGLEILLISSTSSFALQYVIWPALYLLLFLNMRPFIARLSFLSGRLAHINVRLTWIMYTLEMYPGPWTGRVRFVLRLLSSYVKENILYVQCACKQIPAAILWTLYRGAHYSLNPSWKCATSSMLAIFGFYQSIGLLRFPLCREEERVRSVATASQTFVPLQSENFTLSSEGEFRDAPMDIFNEGEEDGHEEELIRNGELSATVNPVRPLPDFSSVAHSNDANTTGGSHDVIDGIEEEDEEVISQSLEQPRSRSVPARPAAHQRFASALSGTSRRRQRGLMDSVRSLIDNFENVPRSLGQVQDNPESTSQAVLLAIHMVLRSEPHRCLGLSEDERRFEREREERLVYR